MKVGDYIKHVGDNTGQGPNGAWVIMEFNMSAHGTPIIIFSDDTWCGTRWMMRELQDNNAVYIPRGSIVTHKITKHNLI